MKKPLTRQILTPKDAFYFTCRPGIECYTSCCGNVNIFLTPYDVIRLRHRLNMGSAEFLEQYTVRLASKSPVLPLVVLKMGDDPHKRCQLVTDQGCTVYPDRPWACRMFPLDQEIKDKYGFITDERRCKGLVQGERVVVRDWLETQGIKEYNEWNGWYEELTGDTDLSKLDVNNPKVRDMVYLATYDLDRFRRFVLESRFLDTFDLEQDLVERIRTDDLELLRLGLRWIKFGLFGEKTLKIRDGVLEARRDQVGDAGSRDAAQ